MDYSNKYIIFLTISKRNNLKITDYFNFFTIDYKNRKFLSDSKDYHIIKSFMTKKQYLKLFNNSSNIKEFNETLKTGFLKYLNYDMPYLMDINNIFKDNDKINIIYINTRFYYKQLIEQTKEKENNPFYDPNKSKKEKNKQKYQQIWLDSEKVVLSNGKSYVWGNMADKINEIAYQKELKRCEGIMLYDYRTSYQIKQEEQEKKNKEIALKLYNSYDKEFPILDQKNKKENKIKKEEIKQKELKPEISNNKLVVSSPIPLKNKFSGL